MIFKKNKFKIYENKIKYNKINLIYNIELESKITNPIKKLKILHLSDTHFQNKKYLKEEYKLLTKIFEKEKFDLIFHTGDVIDKNVNEFEIEFQNFLKSLKSRYGKFFVLGNHNLYKKNQIKKIEKIMQKNNFKNLTNTNYKINLEEQKIKINLIGLDDAFKGKPNYNSALKNINITQKKKEFNILLTHNLDALKKEKMRYFNLIFSGHLHAGEFNFGIFDGITYLKLVGHFKNIHKQKKGFKQLSNNLISFIHPSNYCGICDKTNNLFNRIFTKKAGPVIIKIK